MLAPPMNTRLLIGAELVPGEGAPEDILDPATGQVIARYRNDNANPESLSNDEKLIAVMMELGRTRPAAPVTTSDSTPR